MVKNKTPHKTDEPLWLKTYPPAIKWDHPLKKRPVFDILYNTQHNHGNRPAFDFLGKCWNWNEITTLVNKMAKGLQEEGIGKGIKVGLFLPNSPLFLISYYAVLRAGATVVNYNPLYIEKDLHHQIEDSETDYMITFDLKILYDKMHAMLHETRLKKLIIARFTDFLPFPKNMLFKILKGQELAKIEHPARRIWFSDLIVNDGAPADVTIKPDEDVAVIQYTGGTTGVPKGAMLTHANIHANTEQSALWFEGAKPGKEKMMGVLPFFHVFAMTAVMNLSVWNGFEIVALPRFDLKQTLKTIHKKRPHYLPAVPAIYSAINNCKELDKYDLTSLRFCISGGAPLPVEVKAAFEKNTGCVVVEGYGLTESSPVACVNPITGENKAGSIGLPLPGTTIEIVDMEGKDIIMPIGERGELCIRGPQVMKGYWNKPEATADTLRNGRLHTGDIAIMDENGYVYIVDRLKDMIITNGYNVYPRNVEEAIYQHPEVEECIVAGLPDDKRGEIVKAWIKPKDGQTISTEDMKSFLADKLSKIEIPRHFEFRTEPLPKTMIGKLSRKDIIKEELEKST